MNVADSSTVVFIRDQSLLGITSFELKAALGRQICWNLYVQGRSVPFFTHTGTHMNPVYASSCKNTISNVINN